MSDSGEEDQETYSDPVTKKKQRVYIKIECLKPATHYSSLFANNDKTTFLPKKTSFTKRDKKRSTQYSL